MRKSFTMADRLSCPTESGAIHIDPSVWALKTTVMEFIAPCHAELDSASIQCDRKSVKLARSRNKFGMTAMAFTMADRLSRLHNGLVGSRLAFTMAEILLSLTIIGVVAAITLPSLTGNINERTWNTQRKALYARFSQAIALMPALNGYGTFRAASGTSGTSSYNAGEDNVAETFITSGLAKVLKINNICDSDNVFNCGVPNKIVPIQGSPLPTPKKISELNSYLISNPYSTGLMLDTKAAAFETQNGESVLLFYNPNCAYYMNEYDTKTAYTRVFIQPKVCANLIFDMNGNKGPNTVGKDIGFMTIFYPTDSVLAAPNLPAQRAADRSANQEQATTICKEQDPEYRIPTLDELGSMFVNQKLINGDLFTGNTDYWSSKVSTSTLGWSQGFTSGAHWLHSRDEEYIVHCVKR